MSAPSLLMFLVRVAPRGAVRYDPDSVALADLTVLADGLDAVVATADAMVLELVPDSAEAELDRWEAEYDLNRAVVDTARRQARLRAARQFLPNATPTTLVAILDEATGELGWSIDEPGPFRCDDPNSLTDTPTDVIDGVFVFWATAPADTARATVVIREEVQDLVDRASQAHVQGKVRFTGEFCCDDAWSLTDLDLLGV